MVGSLLVIYNMEKGHIAYLFLVVFLFLFFSVILMIVSFVFL